MLLFLIYLLLLWHQTHTFLKIGVHETLTENTTLPQMGSLQEMSCLMKTVLTPQGRMTHKCFRKLRHNWVRLLYVAYLTAIHYLNQCFIVVNQTFRTPFDEIVIKIELFLFKELRLEISYSKYRPFCPGPDTLNNTVLSKSNLNIPGQSTLAGSRCSTLFITCSTKATTRYLHMTPWKSNLVIIHVNKREVSWLAGFYSVFVQTVLQLTMHV